MAGIFISYRRADSDGWAGRLRDTLRVRFGDLVFQDVDNIPDGEIFSNVIDRALQECDVALVIIGPNWASALDEKGQRRLDQEDDWVRTETAMVLSRNIRVIPVLVGGARLPRADELPEELRSLTRRQAREIRSTSWDSDVALLTNHLKQIVAPRGKRTWLYAAPVLGAVLLGLGVFAGGRYFWQSPISPAPDERAAPSAPPTAMKRDDKAPAAAAPPETRTTERQAPRAEPAAAAPKEPDRTQAASKPAQPADDSARSARQEKAREATRVVEAKPAETPKPQRSPQAQIEARKGETVATAKPPVARSAAPESQRAQAQTRDTPPPAAPVASVPEARKPAAATDDTAPERVTAAPAAAKAPAAVVARAVTLNLPNRPVSARELKIGDSWTYRLREARFDRELATVTHEIGGGDSGGIRETVRLVLKRSGDADPETAGASRATRRLPLEPRIFEQQLNQNATLFEFAPFLTAFSDLQPGVRWSKIAGATSTDSINDWKFNGRVTGRERVRVPAGTFDAIKAELEGELAISFPSTRDPYSETTVSYQTYSIWFVPEIGREVKYERRTFNRVRRLLEHEQYELLSYQLK